MRVLDLSTARWRKSTRSSESDTCVEIAFLTDLPPAAWRKSTHSADSDTCVEVAFTDQAVGIRDSKNLTGPALAFPSPALSALLVTTAE
jgi:hypothetical protein